MQKTRTKNIVYSALFAALVFVGTQFIRVPLPFGYFNFGDFFVISSAYVLGGPYAIFASAAGSALADMLSGYMLYAPATLLIKSLMVIVVVSVSKLGSGKSKGLRILFSAIGAVLAEILMVSGYFVYDVALYQIAGATAALFGNVMQGAVSSAASVFFVHAAEHVGLNAKKQ